MATPNNIARFVFDWTNQNKKQLQIVTEKIRAIEGAGEDMFSREQLEWGDWRRYHHSMGIRDARLAAHIHLNKLSNMCEEAMRGSAAGNNDWWTGDEPEPLELHPPPKTAENDPPAGIHDLTWKRQELDAQNKHLSEAIRQKGELVKSLTLEETELRANISHWMIKKSALRKECQEIEIRRDAVLDGTPTEVDILDRKERLKDLESDIESAEAKVGFLTEHIKRLEISESRLTEEVRAEWIRDYKTPVLRAQLRARLAEINDLLRRITDELPAISEFRADDMEDAVDLLCLDLPEGWLVSLRMEKDAAWVAANDPAGRDVGIDVDGSLIDQLISALELAKKQSEVD